MKKYGIGIIGMGWMGEAHSSAYINYNIKFAKEKIKAELIICSELLEQRAKEAKEKFGFKAYSTDWKAVVEHPEVDIVDITAPNSLHLEIIQYCIKKGKHINCEKPVGAFPHQSLQAYELIKNSPCFSFVGFNYRLPPLVQYTKKLIESGKLGQIYHYKGSFFSSYAADNQTCYSWRFEKENGLGAVSDLLSHVIDMAHYLIGDIQSLSGSLKTFITQRPIAQAGASHYAKAEKNAPCKAVSNDDYACASVRFKNGVLGFIDASRCFYGPSSKHSFELYAEKGSVRWNFEDMNSLELFLKDKDKSANGYKKIYSSPHHPYHSYFNPSDGSALGYDDLKVMEVANFLKNISRKKRIFDNDFKAAAKVARVVEAILASNESLKEEKVGSIV